jgi:hypothetical protein
LEKLNSPLVVLAVGVLVVVVNVLLFYRSEHTRASATSTSTSPSLENNNAFAAAAMKTPSEGEEEKASMVVGVEDVPAGLSIYEDGQLVVDQVVEPGFSKEFDPQEDLTISTDNAGAVSTKVGEWELGPLGANDEPITRDFERGS